ncbi:MAG: hypothetical protein N2450_02325 [bacterium]|nr:hypothetical protein [bacterium]
MNPPEGTSRHLNALKYINNVLYIVGEDGFIAKEIEGNNYTIHYHPQGITFWDITNTGTAILVFGDFGVIYRSTDGEHWITVTEDSIAAGLRYRKAAIDGANRIWAIGENTFLHYSTDDGITWYRANHQNLLRYREFSAIAFYQGGYGYLTTSTVGFWTTNNGIEWLGTRSINYSTNHILFVSHNEMYLACNGGIILRSFDLGSTFQPMNLFNPENEVIFKVVQLHDRTFLAVSAMIDSIGQHKGKVWRSKNGMDWWTIFTYNQEIRDIAIGDYGSIMICGTNGFLASISRSH